MAKSPVPPSTILLIAWGFILWASAFVTLYAVNAIGCAFGWPEAFQRGVVIGLALGFIVATGLLAVWSYRQWKRATPDTPRPRPNLAYIGIMASGAAFVATIGTLVPVLFASMCI